MLGIQRSRLAKGPSLWYGKIIYAEWMSIDPYFLSFLK